jgi:hypothetical protein
MRHKKEGVNVMKFQKTVTKAKAKHYQILGTKSKRRWIISFIKAQKGDNWYKSKPNDRHYTWKDFYIKNGIKFYSVYLGRFSLAFMIKEK